MLFYSYVGFEPEFFEPAIDRIKKAVLRKTDLLAPLCLLVPTHDFFENRFALLGLRPSSIQTL